MARPRPFGPVYGIVLAAGMSRRLGRPKQLLEIEGKPLVRHVAVRTLAAGLDGVIVVVGHEGDRVREALAGLDVRVVDNPRFADGQSTSLIAGIDAMPEGTDAAVLLLGDQPGIRVSTIDALIAARQRTGAPVVMAIYGDVRSHPALFGSETFPELRAITGDMGARDVIRTYGDRVLTVDGEAAEPPADVDTEEAYAAMLRDGLPDG